MITGRGMVAKAFKAFAIDPRVHVFASGVSRSGERDPSAFRREAELIKSQRHIPGRFIYFSTSSIHDRTLTGSPYILHKRGMEALIHELFPDHLIFRLPNLVGRTENANTLTNFLRDRIIRNELFELHVKACRYILDVEDVARDLSPLLSAPGLSRQVLDVNSSKNIPMPELLMDMEMVLGRRARFVPVDRGDCYIIDNQHFLNLLPHERRQAYTHPDTQSILRKYYG